MIPLQDTVPSRSFPLVNSAMIGLNVMVFFGMISLGVSTVDQIEGLAVVPARLLGQPGFAGTLTLVTSMFLHGGWSHLISNMIALYIFGDNVEDRLGSGRYLLLYLVCGVAAGLAHVAMNPQSTVPTIGASGAVSGVLAAYVLLFPTARVITLVPLFFWPWFLEIPALFYVGSWFLAQLLNGVFTVVAGVQAFGGVAWWAHVGGFVVGLALTPLLARRDIRRTYVDEYWPW